MNREDILQIFEDYTEDELDMGIIRDYLDLCYNSVVDDLNTTVEKHHILPKSRFPEFRLEGWNLVSLTPKDHYRVHELLSKSGLKGMGIAFYMMSKLDNGQYCSTPDQYEESRQLFVNSISGESHPLYGKKKSPETLEKLRVRFSGEGNPMYGKNHSDQTKMKIAQSKIGLKFSEEECAKRSIRSSGNLNPMYGKEHSEETRAKISEGVKSVQKVKCQYCNAVLLPWHISRYHNDNCKHKKEGSPLQYIPTITDPPPTIP